MKIQPNSSKADPTCRKVWSQSFSDYGQVLDGYQDPKRLVEFPSKSQAHRVLNEIIFASQPYEVLK